MAAPALQPSAFTFGQDAPAGRHSNIFDPPKSPSTTATSTTCATATDYFGPSARKRSRSDMRAIRRQISSVRTPRIQATSPLWLQCPTPNENVHFNTFAADSIFANEKYTLAGGFDTPSLKASMDVEEPYERHAVEGQRRSREAAWEAQQHEPVIPIFGPLARERNGMARTSVDVVQSQIPISSTWTGLAFGLVGKVFSFGTNVIRGFYAGGGQGFDLKSNENSSTPFWPESGCSTPLPGAWTDDDFLGDFEQDNFGSTPCSMRPPNKRRQTDKDAWVVIGDQDDGSCISATSPKRKVDTVTTAIRNNSSVRPSASRAPSRRTLAPTTRRMPSYGTYSNGSPAHNVIQSSNEPRASTASMRSPAAGRSNNPGNVEYLSPEAERFVKRQARQEKAADRAMSSMSRQLEDLIRQGQEALGTKVSIEGLDCGFDMDEGFVDDE